MGAGIGAGGNADGDRFDGIENMIGTRHGDIISGDGGSNLLAGNDGDDRLFGRMGDDALIGGGGDDILRGGRGDDKLRGGSGSDAFVFGDMDIGSDMVMDMSLDDAVGIVDPAFLSASEVLAALRQEGDDAVLRIAEGVMLDSRTSPSPGSTRACSICG